jgi:hypothetical protein
MTLLGRKIAFTPSVIFLILMNMIPVVGVFTFGWDVGTLLLLYWLESIVIGLLNVPKILSAQGVAQSSRGSRKAGFGGKLFLSLFFTVHFGGFSLGHYLFLDSFFKSVPPLNELMNNVLSAQGLLFAMLGLFISHLFSMVRNFYGKGEYLTRSPNSQMFLPYGRVFIMHFVIILGGALVQAFGAPILALLLLVVLKTGIDLVSHAAEHRFLGAKTTLS